ncbi:MAG TPA: sensor histidine kinase [Agrococcus sp.]|nr:sensor histidine kinase [Agrococcus sp.]
MMPTEQPVRVRRRAARWWFVALAAAAVALFAVLAAVHAALYDAPAPFAMLLAAAMCGAPIVALRRPRTAIALFCVAAFLLPLLVLPGRDETWPWPWSVPAMLALVLFVGVVTVRHGWRTGIVPLAISIIGSLVAPLLLPDAASAAAAGADLIVTASIAVIAFAVAVLLGGRIRVGEQLGAARELTALEQSRRVQLEERTRIARELHDVVAHSMSLIQVRSSTARYRIPDLPADAVAELDEIAATARASLTEMRRLLGVLRTEGDDPQLVPQQGIADIPALAEGTRRAGATVELAIAEPVPDLPPSVQIAAFRIVQEALSNAVRHARGAPISVAIGLQDDDLLIRVTNARPPEPAPPAPGGGHGLRGMRERVALLGGRLTAGPDDEGGWSVTAALPLPEEESR